MALQLSSFDFSRGRPPEDTKWLHLLDGNIHVLEQGVDYSCSSSNMRAIFYRMASKQNMTSKTRLLVDVTLEDEEGKSHHIKDGIVIQAEEKQ